ncbi:hemolysin family protein [Pelagicoccus sp. SDUM812003]|uniref:hemolysin family protein n=1 Tax=Pelagicoccus sp. SDUM812003 TaxID=3041267 RepID=UPI00280C4D11|nr:hemolysin family protein [Pelagicoccus sp. SDUM812003]MDQ8202777.1 hemolysin family protein [Pelagicoccus sp. SDUM812003]
MYEYSAFELTAFGIGAAVLLLLNAAFVAAEFSLVKLRFTRFSTSKMKRAAQSERIAALLEDMSSSIKLLRLGISLCSIGCALLLLPLAYTLTTHFGWAIGWELRFSIMIGLVVSVGAHFVLGELVPRALALQYPVQSIRVALPLVIIFRFVVRPVSAVLNGVSSLILRALRLDPSMDFNLLYVQAQIRSIVDEGIELPAFAESIVSNALELGKRVAHDIMIPRNQLQYIDLEDTIDENLELARKTGHTRFPLCEGDLDHCVGIIHVKDVFRSGKNGGQIDWRRLMRPMLRFSMDEPLERVLQRFLKTRKHFGLLTDEFGGTVGAVTLEDVLEELVGEIQDEFDREEALVSEIEGGVYLVDGLTPLHDLSEEIGVDLQADEVSTFGGYLTYELGRMPAMGEELRIKGLEIVITAVDERRVLSAQLRVVKDKEEEETESPAES